MMNLSPRHRAMLQEMGVPLWWPEQPAKASGAAAQRPDEGIALTVRDMAPAASASRPLGARARAGAGAGSGASQASQVANKDSVAAPQRAASTPAIARPAASLPRSSPVPSAEVDDFVPVAPVVDFSRVGWSELKASVDECRACRLCLQRTNTVFGVGTEAEPHPERALDWLVVGEGPGEQEDMQGEPFVGAAGKLLDQMLAAMQLSRTRTHSEAPSLYITNVVKCRPPGNRNPMPDEVEACSAHLHAQIRLLRPRFILAMGRFAAQTLLRGSVADIDTVALGKLRGTVHRHGDIPVVVSYHPSYLLRNPAEKAKSWADLCLALQAWDGTNRTA